MSEEQDIKNELESKFPSLAGKVIVQRERRIFAEAPRAEFEQVFDAAVKQMGFSILCTITGVDNGDSLGAIYHLARQNGTMLNLSVRVPLEKPVLRTVTGYFPAADAYEREMIDLLGMEVEGLPPGSRYPLTDDWPKGQYPLRKSWTGLKPAEEKEHGEPK